MFLLPNIYHTIMKLLCVMLTNYSIFVSFFSGHFCAVALMEIPQIHQSTYISQQRYAQGLRLQTPSEKLLHRTYAFYKVFFCPRVIKPSSVNQLSSKLDAVNLFKASLNCKLPVY